MCEAIGKTDWKSKLKLAANPTKSCVQGCSLLSGSGVTWSKISLSSQGPSCCLQSAQHSENFAWTFSCKARAPRAPSKASYQVLMRPEVGGAQPLKEWQGFPWWSSYKNLPCNAGDVGSVPGLGTRISCEKKKERSLSRAELFATPMDLGTQAPLSMEFSRQEYWSGLPFPSPLTMGQLNQCTEINILHTVTKTWSKYFF